MVVLGSIAHSLMVQQAWSDAAGMATGGGAAALSFGDRISWIMSDLVGMETRMAPNAPPYGALTTVALLIAFLVAGLLARFTGLRPIVFAVAGAVAIFVLFTALKATVGTVGVFGARGMMGLSLQMTAGLIAGAVFAMLTRPRMG
jgi:cellobiose-specific phosphotransferase system component IIC